MHPRGRAGGRGRRAVLAAVAGLTVALAGTGCAGAVEDGTAGGTATGDAAADGRALSGTTAATASDAVTSDAAEGPMTAAPPSSPPAHTDAPDPGTGGHRAVHSLTFIAMGDGGASGSPVGCGDSAVPVDVETSTIAPLGEVYRAQLAAEGPDHGRSGLYNALARSDLQYVSAAIDGGHATVRLTGHIRMGGECDAPRVRAQLTEPALQFPNVDSVTVLIDGVPLDQTLSLR